MMPHLADRRGFALPAVILLVALLTVLLTSGLTRARVERQIAEASDASDVALTIAQSGLQSYLGTVTARPADLDSTRINLPGGYASVLVHLVQRPADTTQPWLYLVRSTGVVINPSAGPEPRALRTVAQFAAWEIARIERPAALTTINGSEHWHNNSTPSRLEVSGFDQCGLQPGIAGIRTIDMAWRGGHGTPDTSLMGNPRGLIETGSGNRWPDMQALSLATRIDWARTLGTGLIPDYTSFQNGSTTYPIQRITGQPFVSLSGTGTGLLVVENNMETAGTSFSFDGIILVGGYIDFQARTTVIRGLVITGLNALLGSGRATADNTETGNRRREHEGRKNAYLYYNSCIVQTALSRVAGLVPIRNAWMDNWASY